ncbi:cytosine/purine/uracil/thiamine/allantoin permease family protein [Klebsiella pneumoniae]|uniref:Cytosine/purine/uracil/thiamine/allantoin permease family protein n=1 Tax=Klebsiella pneumoniae TaxID=573 RepID=A0A2X1QJI3_KLEPN|nr:cytosine/purine/uracil/thiamine/allantoin permease family protein [Klebsiella pneumoniae]
MLVLLKFWPSLASLTSSSFLGLSPLGWLCFATMWLLQAMVFWHGMNASNALSISPVRRFMW